MLLRDYNKLMLHGGHYAVRRFIQPSCGSLTSPIMNLNDDDGDDDVRGDDPSVLFARLKVHFLTFLRATPCHYFFLFFFFYCTLSVILYYECDDPTVFARLVVSKE